MDLAAYKPNDTEKWLSKLYQKNGIHYATDIDIDRIAEMVNVRIVLRDDYKAIWDDSFGLIYLKKDDPPDERRQHFFHELGHVLRHAGSQFDLPASFIELQEYQANAFQLYASIPTYILAQHALPDRRGHAIAYIAEVFRVPVRLAERRLNQIQRRIFREMFFEAIAEYKQKPDPNSEHLGIIVTYPETERLLQQLHTQTKRQFA